jgi:ankyrin repeat protein
LLSHRTVAVNSIGKYNRTPLHVAAKLGHISIIEMLLAHGANASLKTVHGFTALYVAAVSNQLEAVAVLIASGHVDVDDTDLGGMTPLIAAACNKCSPEVIKHLLDGGASLAAQDCIGRNALDWAREKHHDEIYELFISYQMSRDK